MNVFHKKICFILLLVGVLALSPAVVSSASETAAVPASIEDIPVAKELSGKIVAVQPTESMLSVEYLKDKDQHIYETTMLMVTSLSEIVRDAVEIPLADLKIGEQVSVQYVTDFEGKKIVSSLYAEHNTAAEIPHQGGV
ncbi:MAG: hypothetical protein A2787_06755 [Omnitrophica WOR_2 bacterium RIFCSPHIGHO2_01_FULL_48_9]|nr:MAG: hypothetical protein A3D10_09530 [Omnitrophica WOR_2 bacterium RIFCSPHIGHO2_02_FULL_48_11]OGX29964.1 MAG: hypothetical protein A2787_06755 [Omnitrophica WOR_2 bacterium RIFCSPHIGHO2_01_FULL_48_9]